MQVKKQSLKSLNVFQIFYLLRIPAPVEYI